METTLFPVPGAFLRPVGHLYGYCYEVVRIAPADANGSDHWTMRRWGMGPDHQPFDDGHLHLQYLTDLQRIAPGVWRDTDDAWEPHHPTYFRQIAVGGQMELFV